MNYDEKVPSLLKKEQQWFGSIISRPIDEDSRMCPISPSGEPMEEEAALHIAPSPTLRPSQRIQIYNQQYWWRLLNTLQEVFPFLTRLFGYFEFNRTVGIPYLTKYPPRHWSLSLLGDRLSDWLKEEYRADDKELVVQAAELDWAFSCSFTEKAIPPVTLDQLSFPENTTIIFSKQLYIQPFIHLFAYDYDLFEYRKEFLKEEPDFWLNNEFPILDRSRSYYYVLYRTKRNDLSWKEISKAELFILKLLQSGASLEDVCNRLQEQSSAIYEAAEENLQPWFQEWAQRGWLSLEKNP